MKTTCSQFLGTLTLIALLVQSAVLLSCARQVDPPQVNPEPVMPMISSHAEVGSVKLFYEITGAGEPLLLLHGGLGGSEHFAEIVPMLAESFEVITVDRRGHGRSTDNGEPYAYATMADEMNAFIDHLQIDSVKILGFSDGGVVGLHLAATYPQKVTQLVTVGANYRVDGMTQETIDFMTSQMTPENLGKVFPAIEENYRATNPQPENFESFVERSHSLWLRDPYLTDQQMTKIHAPVLFVVGEKDAIRLEHVLEMRSLVENSQLCVLPGATHFVLSENPEVVLPILVDFFTG